MRAGVRLAVDVGTVRIGVAKSDALGMLASPLTTVPRGDGDVARVAAIAEECAAIEIYVGLPKALSGRITASTEDAMGFARALAGASPREVRFVDERLTTVTATERLHAAGRKSRDQRRVIDQAAATIILESALESERRTGNQPGMRV